MTTQVSTKRVWFLPSVGVLVFVLIFWTGLFFMPQMLNGDGDLGRHLVTGNLILTTGKIPTQDVFSYTMAGAPLVPKEWLSQVLFALVYRAAGLNGVAWLTAFILAATCALLTLGLGRFGVRAFTAFAAGCTAFVVGYLHALTRPHIIGWLFFLICLLVLESYRQKNNRRALWLLPVAMVVWANLHGGFISGLALVGFYVLGAALEKKWRQAAELAALGSVLLLASFINPAGPQLVIHNIVTVQSSFLVDLTVEFQSPNFHTISTWPFVALLLSAFVIVARGKRRLDWTPLLLLVGWGAFALYSARYIPLYGLAALLVLAPLAESLIDAKMPALSRFLTRTDALDRLSWGWMWAIVAVVGLIGLQQSGTKLDVRGMGNTFDPHVFPIAAVDTLKESMPAGNMFNEFTWGGYLLYRLWPTQHVFIDGWTDSYTEALTREYLQVLNAAPGWDATLDRYNVQWVIVPPTRPLAARLDASPTWLRRYEDETAGVWVRR